MKRKNNGMYLLNSDIEALNKRYEVLYKQIKDNINLTEAQINRACEVLLEKYNFEIEELCALREVEYETKWAKIKARNREQIPWRRCWLWRLLFQPLTNRAQDIIEQEAELDAEDEFTPKEKALQARLDKLDNEKCDEASQRKREKNLKNYLKFKRKLDHLTTYIDNANGKKIPYVIRHRHKKALKKCMKFKRKLDDDVFYTSATDAPCNVEQTPQENAEPPAPATAAPSPTLSNTEQGASDVAQQGDKKAEPNAGDVSEPPEPPTRKPRSTKQPGN